MEEFDERIYFEVFRNLIQEVMGEHYRILDKSRRNFGRESWIIIGLIYFTITPSILQFNFIEDSSY
jgi:hypothetical protein